MNVFGKRIDGLDLVLAVVGVLLVLIGVAMLVGFFALERGAGRFVLLAIAVAMFAAGSAMLSSTVFKAFRKSGGPPAIDG